MKFVIGTCAGLIAAIIVLKIMQFVIVFWRIRKIRKSLRYALYHADSMTAKIAGERLANLDAIDIKTICREVMYVGKRS